MNNLYIVESEADGTCGLVSAGSHEEIFESRCVPSKIYLLGKTERPPGLIADVGVYDSRDLEEIPIPQKAAT